MSWRQPRAVRNAKPTKPAKKTFLEKNCFAAFASFAFLCRRSVSNGSDLPRAQSFEEAPRSLDVELRVLRLDAKEETIAAGERETRDVEDWMVGLRQPVQRQHAEDARQCRQQDRALEGHRDECWPAVKRFAADVHRIRDRRDPVLQQVAADAAGGAAEG